MMIVFDAAARRVSRVRGSAWSGIRQVEGRSAGKVVPIQKARLASVEGDCNDGKMQEGSVDGINMCAAGLMWSHTQMGQARGSATGLAQAALHRQGNQKGDGQQKTQHTAQDACRPTCGVPEALSTC